MVRNGRRGPNLDVYSPIVQPPDFSVIPEDSGNWDETPIRNATHDNTSVPYSIRDISTWIGGKVFNYSLLSLIISNS